MAGFIGQGKILTGHYRMYPSDWVSDYVKVRCCHYSGPKPGIFLLGTNGAWKSNFIAVLAFWARLHRGKICGAWVIVDIKTI
ncbi:hypothetical protein [Methylovulum sp.]|uniref:hypothetical protein n=1 Tax=Methylovulum sp. TaxID=1916980 RepID=UPI0026033BB2|nr:hypothetical protein [Methylovulum sp.]MDD5126022.1 hypothetical protein [Methylovulum sp.]